MKPANYTKTCVPLYHCTQHCFAKEWTHDKAGDLKSHFYKLNFKFV